MEARRREAETGRDSENRGKGEKMIKLKEMRQKRGMSQTALAEKVRHADPTASQMTISVLEQGELYPSEKLRDALCEALDCSEEDIYDGIEAMFVPAANAEQSRTTQILAEIFALRGAGQRIPRGTLLGLFSAEEGKEVSDRQLRKYIELAKQEGLVIGNDQDGRGYYIPETLKELEITYRQNQSRALAILKQQKHIRRKMAEWR